jgi:ABC-type transport system involved in multi-copper enzyme maturation permease subunit
MPLSLLWAQLPARPGDLLPEPIQWLVVWGDPQFTDGRWFGGLMTWAKVLGLICLVSWLVAQFVEALRSGSDYRVKRRGGLPAQLALLIALGVAALIGTFLLVLDRSGRIKLPSVGGRLTPADLFGVGMTAALFLLVEWVIWSAALRRKQSGGIALLLMVHAALALAFVVVFLGLEHRRRVLQLPGGWSLGDTQQYFETSLRYGATYAGLVVLGWYALRVLAEARHVRWRRLFSIAWHTVVESYRRMWAPWAVLTLFVLVLAFTNWFLGRSRTAELAPMYISTLALVTSLLLTMMVMFLSPISIPNDIRFQTIYTVVSKPVRRLELIWGRLLGYMMMVTAILLVMGVVSVAYVERIVDKRIESTQEAAKAAETAGRTTEAKRLRDDAYQLATRRSARVPIYGGLFFTDSLGRPRQAGIDVGMEQTKRSHIEGATPSKATWVFDRVPDPSNPRLLIDKLIPVQDLLRAGTIESVEDEYFRLRFEQAQLQSDTQTGQLKGNEMRQANERIRSLEARIAEADARVKGLKNQETELARAAEDLRRAGKAAEADAKREAIKALHSDPIPVEMTFNIFRTTKGEEVGEAVQASMVVTNPLRADIVPARLLFPVHEYYTIPRSFPARLLVGCMGRLVIEVQCLTPNQFLGMADDDLFILARRGDFRTNFIRGLAGVWLQALVVTAVGLFASTFLSWPVALLLTLAFYLGGQVAIGFLDQFAQGQVAGGGPFESLIRLLGHQNLSTELDPTPGYLVATTFDQFAKPILSCLVYIVPNLTALDVSNTVASGFAVSGNTLIEHFLLGLGYALPFTAAAYFILKQREVAA